ncbi:MAG: 30S ribosomal protein S12 methylthiotransferase RimO [Spirochaetaceae bacterium]|jgi:ribosomal protein S12 methylthiotransferase|nr:30S ribosomal protein S12 methylthiotransferase RimO [Spirochaetaceae bacterium]
MNFYIESLGCAKNQVESEIMISCLNAAGFPAAAVPEEADIIIINSCGFIKDAKRESINTVLSYRKEYPQKIIILAGCLAIRYAKDLRESLSEADAIYDSLDSAAFGMWLRDVVKKHEDGARAISAEDMYAARSLLSPAGSAYIKVSDGCDNRCSFCAIPLIRGKQRSRALENIVAECKALVGRGVKELCLIAQDLAAYGMDIAGKSLLAELMAHIGGIEGDFWVRLLYLHPDHFPFDILPVISNDSRMLPYFDIPFQHSSQRILRAMNRRGSLAAYLDLLTEIRRNIPGAVFRTTLLTGFPFETDFDFAMLLDFQNRASFDWLGVFTYSHEEGTAAAAFKGGRVLKKTALARKKALEKAQIPITTEKLARLTGTTARALVEKELVLPPAVCASGSRLYLGRLPCQAPEVDGAALIYSAEALVPGAFVSGTITGITGFDIQMKA